MENDGVITLKTEGHQFVDFSFESTPISEAQFEKYLGKDRRLKKRNSKYPVALSQITNRQGGKFAKDR